QEWHSVKPNTLGLKVLRTKTPARRPMINNMISISLDGKPCVSEAYSILFIYNSINIILVRVERKSLIRKTLILIRVPFAPDTGLRPAGSAFGISLLEHLLRSPGPARTLFQCARRSARQPLRAVATRDPIKESGSSRGRRRAWPSRGRKGRPWSSWPRFRRLAVPDARRALRLLPRQPRSAQILTADSVQQQPIAAPEGSEINHGIHRNTRKRESESTSPLRVLPGGNSRP